MSHSGDTMGSAAFDAADAWVLRSSHTRLARVVVPGSLHHIAQRDGAPFGAR